MQELLEQLGYKSEEEFRQAVSKHHTALVKDGYVLMCLDGSTYVFKSQYEYETEISLEFYDEYHSENSETHHFDFFYVNENKKVFLLDEQEFEQLLPIYLTAVNV